MDYVDSYSVQTARETILLEKDAKPNRAVAVILMNNSMRFGIPDQYYDSPLREIRDKIIKHAHAEAVNRGHGEQIKMEHHHVIVERDECANYNPVRDEILENRISNDLKKLLGMEYHSLLEENRDVGVDIATLTKPLRKEDSTQNYWNTLPFPGQVAILEVVTFFNDLKNKSVNELAALYAKPDLDFYLGRDWVKTNLWGSTLTTAEHKKLTKLIFIAEKTAKSNVAYYLQNLLFKNFRALVKKNMPVAKEIFKLTKNSRQKVVTTTTYWDKLSLEERIEILKVVDFLNDLSRESPWVLARKYLGVDKTLDYFSHKLLKSRGLTQEEQAKWSQAVKSKKEERLKKRIAKSNITAVKPNRFSTFSTPGKLYLPDNDFSLSKNLPGLNEYERECVLSIGMNNFRFFSMDESIKKKMLDVVHRMKKLISDRTINFDVSDFLIMKTEEQQIFLDKIFTINKRNINDYKVEKAVNDPLEKHLALACCTYFKNHEEFKSKDFLALLNFISNSHSDKISKEAMFLITEERGVYFQSDWALLAPSKSNEEVKIVLHALNDLFNCNHEKRLDITRHLSKKITTEKNLSLNVSNALSHAQICRHLTAPAASSLQDILLSSFSQLPEYLKSLLLNKGCYSSFDDLATNWNDLDCSNRVQLLYRLPSDKDWVNLLQPEVYETAGLANLNISKENWLNSSSDEEKKSLLKSAANSIKQQAGEPSLWKSERFLESLNSLKKRNLKQPLKRKNHDATAPIFHIRAPKIEKSSVAQWSRKPQLSALPVELAAVDNSKITH